MIMIRSYRVAVVALVMASAATLAQSKPKKSARPPMDLGPALAMIFNNGPTNHPLAGPDDRLVLKALSIRLSDRCGVCFDTEALAYVAGWIGGFVDVSRSSIATTPQGSSPLFPIGDKIFSISPGLRRAAQGHYRGHYRHGDQTVLAYALQGVDVLDLPGVEPGPGGPVITRTLWLGKSAAPLRILASERTPITLLDPSRRATIETGDGGQNFIVLPKLDTPCLLKIGLGANQIKLSAPVAPTDLTNGGPAQWTAPVQTQGRLGNEPGAYAVDTLTLPETNPWNSWMRISALDFFSDGRCAVSTLSGDIWIVSGVDESLQHLRWKRFASGLYEPLGLKIVNDMVYVMGRDRLTRLHDFNGDGEADFYESFNSDLDVYPTYHAFVFDLQTDSAGNFYFLADGNMVDPYLGKHGSLLKLSPDGSKLEIYATGFRAANGLSVGPDDEITCSDNEGHWTPSSKISWIRRGGFYGYNGDPRQKRFAAFQKERPVSRFDPPLCWLPMLADNSSGGQIWVASDHWGLPRGALLHTSYGKCTLFEVMYEDVGGEKQGGVWQFPLRFGSGVMRGRFNPKDGQLYLAGLKGWQTVAVHDGVLQRVRYTGGPLRQPVALHVGPAAITISFGTPLNPIVAADAGSYVVNEWNYQWSSKYGSDAWSVADPGKKGEDPVEIKGVSLSADGKTVVLRTQPLGPVMQMRIQYNLETADGAPLRQEIDNTIHRTR